MLALILIARICGPGGLGAANMLTWTFVTGDAVVTLATAIFYVRMERRDRA